MSFQDLIYKYLDRNYKISLTSQPKQAGEFSLLSVINSTSINRSSLEEELKLVFGDSKEVMETFHQWYSSNIRAFSSNFHEFLNECYVVLGYTNWEVHHNEFGKINTEEISSYYRGPTKPEISVLQPLFERWFDNKVIEATERSMRFL